MGLGGGSVHFAPGGVGWFAVGNFGAIEYHRDLQRPVAPLHDQPVS